MKDSGTEHGASAAGFDLFAVASPSGWAALDPATGAKGAGADLRAALAALKPRRGSRVLAASDSVYSQAVSLPPAQTSSLAPVELESALFYEVEPFCGTARADAAVAFARRADGAFAVAVADKAALGALRDAAAAARCRFAGAAPLPKDAAPDDPAAALAALFPAGGPPAPVVRPPRRRALDPANVLKAGVAALVLATALCLADWGRLAMEERSVRPALEASEAAAAANARIEADADAADRRLREIESARAKRKSAARELAGARGAWHGLLSTLAAESGDGFAVLAIRPAPDAIAAVDGYSPSAAAAADAMARLSAALAPRGWALRPGAVREGAGGLASFSFELSAADAGEGR